MCFIIAILCLTNPLIKSMLNKRFKFLLCSVLMSYCLMSNAQARYDNDFKFIHFGFSLGMNVMDFETKESKIGVDGKVYMVDVPTLKPGFSVGIISDMFLTRYFSLRFTPSLHFGERQLAYSLDKNTILDSITVPSIPISIPFYLKYSSERYGDLRPYLIGGIGMNFDLGQNKEKPIYLKTIDPFFEIGVGCDIYFSFFKLSPELKLSLGTNNLYLPLNERPPLSNKSDEKYSLALKKLNSRILTLTFNFE